MSKDDQIAIKKKYHKNGELKYETPYFNDEKHGIEREFYSNGALKRETPYNQGKKNGVEKLYYENCNIYAEIPYINGRCCGAEKRYSQNGMFIGSIFHVQGLPHGICKIYHSDGSLRDEFYEDGVSSNEIFSDKYSDGDNLMKALCNGEFNKVRDLIENNADVNAPYNENGWTPFLWICKEFGQGDEFKYFVKHGGDVNYKNQDDKTALHILAQKHKYNDLLELQALGCNFNAQDKNGNTPLMAAVNGRMGFWSKSIPEDFFTLTDTSIKNNYGQTVFDMIEEFFKETPELYDELMKNNRKV